MSLYRIPNRVFKHDRISNRCPETVEMVKATEDNFAEDHEKFQELIADAEKPLYEGCPNFTKLPALVQLLNMKGKHGESQISASLNF
jgi:hypothetical protein